MVEKIDDIIHLKQSIFQNVTNLQKRFRLATDYVFTGHITLSVPYEEVFLGK